MPEVLLPVEQPAAMGWMGMLRARLADEGSGEIVALYAVHAATIAAPLAIVPYASRVLGPEHWGVYSIFHSLALYSSMLMEYGFNLSATREVAKMRESRAERARLLTDVFSAKLMLGGVLLLLLFAASRWAPILAGRPDLMTGAALFALGQGASMVWYFQGTARVRSIAGLEIGGRVLAIGLTFFAVHRPADAWLLLAINGFALVLVAALSSAMAVADSGFVRPSLGGAMRTLKDGFSLFIFRGAVSLYTLANSFVLGMLAPPASVGFFAGAERINKGLIGFLNPLIQAYYSRLSHAATGPKKEFRKLQRRSMYAVVGVGLVLGTFIFLAAPLLVTVVLGPGYAPAVRVLRILALLAPLSAISSTLGVHGLLPLGRDRMFNTVIILAGFINLALAASLATRWQHEGMSIAVVSTECFVALAFLADMYRTRAQAGNESEAEAV